MNNKVIISVVVTVLILSGLVGYALLAPKGSQQPSPAPTVTAEPTPTAVPEQKSLKDLLTLGQSVKCTFKDSLSSVSVEGTTYISSGKVRGDFSTMAGGQNVATHMIVENQTSYIWTEGSPTGIKMSFAADSPSSSGSTSQGVDVDKKMDYKCDTWTPDTALFTLPKNVKFTEFTLPTGINFGTSSGQQNIKTP